MHKIIHLTDPHLCANDIKVMGLDPLARLKAALNTMRDEHADASACMITGDLTDAGDLQAYKILRELISDLPMPVYLTLGNHDHRNSFSEVFPNALHDENGFVQGSFFVDGTAYIFVDTLDSAHAAEGAMCEKRLAWLQKTLQKNSEHPVVLFMHHPPFSIGLKWFEPMLLRRTDAAKFWRIVTEAGNVRHIAFGHVHVSTSGVMNGISYSASPGTCHKILDGTSADVATYADSHPSFDVLLIDVHGVRVHGVEPAGSSRIIARETATPDGKGIIEFFEEASK